LPPLLTAWYAFSMAQTIDIEAIRKLSVAERMAIIEQIWDTIPEAEVEFRISERTKAEIRRRAKELRDDPDSGLSHEEVTAWLRSKEWR
jgi:putative addiction module component (TIGR02574 family)